MIKEKSQMNHHRVVSHAEWLADRLELLKADFNVWFTEEQQNEGVVEYNYRREGG